MPLALLCSRLRSSSWRCVASATPAPHVHALCLCSAATTEHPKLRNGFITSLLHTQVCS